jgi:hypothetical protein
MRVSRAAAASAAALLGVLLCPSSAFAQSVDEIVARHIAARGGLEKLRSVQTIRMTRTIATPFTDLKVVLHKKRPHFLRVEQTPPGKQPPSVRGVNADAAWDSAPGGQTTLRSASAAAETRELDADFDGLLVDWKAKGHSVTLEGKEALPGAQTPGGETYKLKVATKSGAVRYVYLDAATYLDRRHTGVLNLPPNRQLNVVIDFAGWRSVDGVMFPFDISEDRTGQEPSVSYATYTEKIELNVPMEDALFATPAGAGADARNP